MSPLSCRAPNLTLMPAGSGNGWDGLAWIGLGGPELRFRVRTCVRFALGWEEGQCVGSAQALGHSVAACRVVLRAIACGVNVHDTVHITGEAVV